ncbi:MAG: precorrin-6A reductase [Eubacteriales bacterium]|nr:precorrin-6A reductase [Eubacteriales bacterium]
MTKLEQKQPLVLFGGTSEGRELAEFLRREKLPVTVFVASEYGQELLPEAAPEQGFYLRVGRLDEAGIKAALKEIEPRLVIDATHPYARLVSVNLEKAAKSLDYPYLRLLRAPLSLAESQELGGLNSEAKKLKIVEFSTLPAMVEWLNQQPGRIFSSLGAKACSELSKIREIERLTVRILPLQESFEAALKAAIPAKNIICMQGPFSRDLNLAMFRATGAEILLTKESGQSGGFLEKLEAAVEGGLTVAVLSRPEESKGLSLAEIKQYLLEVRDGQNH